MINIVTDPEAGGTFLAWSLHYLAGHEKYFLSVDQQWHNLPSNPLTKINAHNFQPNKPEHLECNLNQFQQFIKNLETTTTDKFHTLYFHHSFADQEAADYAMQYINTSGNKLIIVDTSDTTLYHCNYNKRTYRRTASGEFEPDDEYIQQNKINRYFKDSKTIWDQLNLNNIWDHREFLALNFRPLTFNHAYPKIDKSINHFVIKGQELWIMFDRCVPKLFEYINAELDQQRFSKWLEVYAVWKNVHYQRLTFSLYFETIVNSILNNYPLDLLRFNLDIEQEAAIQHALLYKHNLNLKTWQLEKFISTTQLHNLLEPNTHTLSS
jgi:hypothetical protein